MKQHILSLVAATFAGLGASATFAAPLSQFIDPTIVAGAPPDSPSARIDPNTPSSAFSGVVSINIRYDGQSYICSGTLVSKRDVVTAGHCVDTNGQGVFVDLKKPGTDVRVVFNSEATPGSPGRAVVTATSVKVHSDYKGFGVCPAAAPTGSFCVNDDVAVVTLGQDAPSTAKIYRLDTRGMQTGEVITMVGYGTAGDGINGLTVSPDFRIKRSGKNVADLFDLDDEQGFAAGMQEVWYADFDGVNANGVKQDPFCDFFGVCTPALGNSVEASIGGGDSGGSTFAMWGDEYVLVGNNTFSGRFSRTQLSGTFGTYFGGMVLSPYLDFIVEATDGRVNLAPAPATIPLVGFGMLAAAFLRRRKSH